MPERLTIALLHMAVVYRDPFSNRRTLLAMIDEAAAKGARIIVAPEMSLSGYSFDSRSAISPFVEDQEGPALKQIRRRAESHGVFICIGAALEDKKSKIFTNSAVVVAPNGNMVCRYDKINAESRWACPGNPFNDNTFETPWGKVGVLICSDSYHGLMPRIAALRGVDLLLVPANWPPSGMDPLELWRGRALENGFYLAGCNRTGMDRLMDCRKAESCVYDPAGELLLKGSNEQSQVFTVDLPLTNEGRLDSRRLQRLSNRRPENYHDCYLNLRMIGDVTEFYHLPPPGDLAVHCIVPDQNEHPCKALKRYVAKKTVTAETLFLLPAHDYSDECLGQIAETAAKYNIGLALCVLKEDGGRRYLFYTGEKLNQWDFSERSSGPPLEFPHLDFGPARLHFMPFSAAVHPEQVVAASKQGCDILIALEKKLSPEDPLIAGLKTIARVVMCVCAKDGAGIWTPPEGHARWGEELAQAGAVCQLVIDTAPLRAKRFQDSIDFNVLLDQNNGL